ncbi:MAG: hypothetical protein HY064_01875 [Bacteroidetes bacterium]|nr:hypothetical protein [Bacteroidota bacterium]
MKKFLRISFTVILILAAGAMFTWFLFIRRTIPVQAKYIPRDAVAVLTLDMRELSIDLSSGKHLFPEMKNFPAKGIFADIKRAVDANHGSGMVESADVVAFIFREKENAFLAVSARLNDETVFSSLVTKEIAKKYPVNEINSPGIKKFCVDTAHNALISWNKEIALFLVPLSNSDLVTCGDAAEKILTMKEEVSLMEDENFCSHERSSFDAGIWIHAGPLLEFSKGGTFFRDLFDNVDYLSFNIIFSDGNISARKLVTKKKSAAPDEIVPCIPAPVKDIRGFFNFCLHLENDEATNNTARIAPLDELPLETNETVALCKFLNGQCTVLLHDTFSSVQHFITFDYDENFNPVERTATRSISALGKTICFGLKKNLNAASFIDSIMKKDSVEKKNGAYLVDDNGTLFRLMLSGNELIWTNWKGTDGASYELPDEWSGKSLYLDPRSWFNSENSEVFSFILPDPDNGKKIIQQQIAHLSLDETADTGKTGSSEFIIEMKNKNINALIQLADIARKLME